MKTETLNPTREAAPAPKWSERRLLEAHEKHKAKVKAVLTAMPRWRFPLHHGPELENFRRDCLFWIWGALTLQGIDAETAGEMAADVTVMVIDGQINAARLRCAEPAGNA